MRGFQRALQNQIGDATRPMQDASRSFVGGLGRTVAGATLAVGAAVGAVGVAVGAIALRGGLDRALAIEQAEAKLTGLGHSADSVASIMENALGAVRGTAFGLGDAAGVAATIVASGVRPGQELEDTLRLVADAATIAGSDMSSMGAIFSKVAASNKLQMDTINQLHDAGIPALQLVADELGVTAEEASRMASRGEVDFATFSRAMEAGLGGAALSAGETFSGAMANVRASLSRLGAQVWQPVIDAAPPVLANLQGLFDDLGVGLEGPLATWASTVEAAAGRVNDAITWVRERIAGGFEFPSTDQIVANLSAVSPAFGALAGALAANWPAIKDSLSELADSLQGALGDAIEEIAPVLPTLGEALADVLIALLPLVPSLVDLLVALTPLIPVVADLAATVADELAPAIADLLETGLPLVTWALDLVTGLADLQTVLLGFGFPNAETTVEEIESVYAAVDRVLALFGTSLDEIFNWAATFKGHIVTGVEGAKKTLGMFLEDVKKTFSNAPTLLLQRGREIVQGLIDGIRQQFPVLSALASQILGIASGAKGAASAAAYATPVASPARAVPSNGGGGGGGPVNVNVTTQAHYDEYRVGRTAGNAVAAALR